MSKKWNLLWVLPLALFVAMGCAKKADPNKPIDQIKAEVKEMSVSDLQSHAQAYAKEITAKRSEVDKVKAQLKGLSPKDLLGEKGKGIREDVSEISKELSALMKRYDIYAKQFRAKGGDISEIKIS